MAENTDVTSGSGREASSDSPGDAGGPGGVSQTESASPAAQATAVGSGGDTATVSAPKGPSPVRRLLTVLLVAALFGAAGYLVVPRSARSALSEADESLRTTKAQLEQTRQARQELSEDLAKTRAELTEARTQLAELENSGKAVSGEVEAAKAKIADLESNLGVSKGLLRSVKKDVADARREALANEQAADQARTLAGELEQKLNGIVEQRDDLAKVRQQLLDEQARLTGALATQKRLGTDLTRLLSVLEVGKADHAPVAASAPGERPITAKELRYWLGQPTVVVQKATGTKMHWGAEHTAIAIDGVVTEIDGKPAVRQLLAGMAKITPTKAGAPWRIAKDQPVRYVDLLAMFGRPDGTTGMGDEFQAWWSVGAWARTATAKIVNGVVTEFDGRQASPALLCELVRHRAEAYHTPNRSAAAAARFFYNQAVGVIEEHLTHEAMLQARDGWTLTEWKLADFDSVGTWVAPTKTPVGAMTMRAAVVCTWVAGDGRVSTQQRYVVVTLGSTPKGVKKEDFAMFAPRQ